METASITQCHEMCGLSTQVVPHCSAWSLKTGFYCTDSVDMALRQHVCTYYLEFLICAHLPVFSVTYAGRHPCPSKGHV